VSGIILGGGFMFSEILPIASPIIAVLALFIALLSWRANIRTSRLTQHYNYVMITDRMLGENKELLRFHGINPDTIEKEYGVTSIELSYLLQSFNGGSIFYYLVSKRKQKKPFTKGSYYYRILKNDATQKAFPLIRQLFDSKNPFIVRCAETIRLLNKNDS
jgi:hypothetical protein